MNIVINLNKPENISSQQAVLQVKKLLAARKAGHAGTLDPIATGVLIVCLNEATKITRFLSDLDKEYVVRLKFGERTDTYDSTGRILEKKDYQAIREEDIRYVLNNFTGHIDQTPPMFSAIKVGGKPLYKLARKGINIERPVRSIHISEITLLSFTPPYIDLKVTCSKGTYIRTLCEDIGKTLGVGAHMVALQRTEIGNFRIEDSISIEELKHKESAFFSMDSALSHFGEIILDEDSYRKARSGIPIIFAKDNRFSSQAEQTGEEGLQYQLRINEYVRLKAPDKRLFGIGRIESEIIKIERLLDMSFEK